jgi:hypothetical protein
MVPGIRTEGRPGRGRKAAQSQTVGGRSPVTFGPFLEDRLSLPLPPLSRNVGGGVTLEPKQPAVIRSRPARRSKHAASSDPGGRRRAVDQHTDGWRALSRGGDTPGCVTRQEFYQVRPGMRIGGVHQVFDTAGRVASRDASRINRYYKVCRVSFTPRTAVHVIYRNDRGVWVMQRKWADAQ